MLFFSLILLHTTYIRKKTVRTLAIRPRIPILIPGAMPSFSSLFTGLGEEDSAGLAFASEIEVARVKLMVPAEVLTVPLEATQLLPWQAPIVEFGMGKAMLLPAVGTMGSTTVSARTTKSQYVDKWLF